VKPVVVSMSDYAASGGYYIATGADRIVAQPGTLTGSIGIYGGKLNLLGLYRKLGLNVESLSRGRHAEMMSPFTDFDAEESRRYTERLEDSYRIFLDRVAEGRDMSREAADSLGQGRVWSGVGAWERGLVDTLGGLNTAFDVALVEAGISPRRGYRVEPLPKVDRSFIERLLEDWLGNDQYLPPGVPLPQVLGSWLAGDGRFAGVLPLARVLESWRRDRGTRDLGLPRVLRSWLAALRFPAGTSLALMPYSIEIR
jgi:protease-4